MDFKTYRYSPSFKICLWIAIFAVFVIVHTPKDKVEMIYNYATGFIYQKSQSFNRNIGDRAPLDWGVIKLFIRLKKIFFLISIIILFVPIIDSLRRLSFLWDSQNIKKRLVKSSIIFIFLSFLSFPINLTGYGGNYALMSQYPFEISSGWLYRRLLMPALAHFLGFQGNLLYHVFSLILVFVLIYLLIAYFEFEKIETNFIDIISIATCSFVIINFMGQGFPDPLMFILFLIAIIASDTHESRLAIITLSLLTHEASLFILGPLILFFYPKKNAHKYLMVIGIYLLFFFLSYMVKTGDFVKTYIVINDKTAFRWVIEYPIRLLGGWIASYKLLWVVIIYGIIEMLRSNELRKALCVLSLGVISPLIINFVTYDVSRHVGWGSLALLMSYSYLIKKGHGKKTLLRYVILLNILIPSIYVGTNAGFRHVGGLYGWLYEISGIQRLLSRF